MELVPHFREKLLHEQIKSNLECLSDALSDYPVHTCAGCPPPRQNLGSPTAMENVRKWS